MNSSKKVFWAVLAKDAESTLKLYLHCLYRQTYDKKQITLYFRTNDNKDNTEQIIREFIESYGHEYRRVICDNASVDSRLKQFDNHEWNPFRFSILGAIRNESLRLAVADDCDFYFASDVDNFIIPQTLQNLVELNLEIVAPLLYNVRSDDAKKAGLGNGEAYSNFHCAMDEFGAYQHSSNYLPILNRDFVGIHQVPLVHCTYLVRRDVLEKVDYLLNPANYEYRNFSISATNFGVKQFLDNRLIFGCLTLLNEVKPASEFLERFEWYASNSSSIAFKVVNYLETDHQNRNAIHIRTSFTKYFSELTCQTIYFNDLQKAKDFVENNPNFRVLDNKNESGWQLKQVGMWASWFKAFEVFLETSKETLILLEDDVWFSQDLFLELPQVFLSLPQDWHCVTLYSPEYDSGNFYTGVDIDSKGYITNPFATWCASAVAFSRSGVQKILSYIEQGIDQNCDQFLLKNADSELNIYSLTPSVMRDKISIYASWKSSKIDPNFLTFMAEDFLGSKT